MSIRWFGLACLTSHKPVSTFYRESILSSTCFVNGFVLPGMKIVDLHRFFAWDLFIMRPACLRNDSLFSFFNSASNRYILRADLFIDLLRSRVIIDMRGMVACMEQRDPTGFVIDQPISKRLTHSCLGAVQFGEILFEQEFARCLPCKIASEFKPLDHAVPNGFDRGLSDRPAGLRAAEVRRFRNFPAWSDSDPSVRFFLFYALRQGCIRMLVDKKHIDYVRRVHSLCLACYCNLHKHPC